MNELESGFVRANAALQTESFWQQHLTVEAIGATLSVANVAPEVDGEWLELDWGLSPAETAAFEQFCGACNLSPETVLAGTWALLLSRYHEWHSPVRLGWVVAGYEPLPWCVSVPATALVQDWLTELQGEWLEMHARAGEPLAEVLNSGGWPEEELPFSSLLVFGRHMPGVHLPGLLLAWVVSPDNLGKMALRYVAGRLDTAVVSRIVGHLRTLLMGMVSQPKRPLHDLPCLTPAEWQQIQAWNKTTADYPATTCIHELIAAQAKETPQATAVLTENGRLAYQQLDEQASRLAHYLQLQGIGPETITAIFLERSPEMIVAILAVLKAGGAYLPLDPNYPAERITYMLADTQARVILTTRQLADTLPPLPATHIFLDELTTLAFSDFPDTSPQTSVTPDNLACIIYTSGSTGQPKGVMLSHRNLVNLVHSFQLSYAPGTDDRLLPLTAVASASFVGELLPVLCSGGAIVLPAGYNFQGLDEVLQLVRDYRVSIISTVPALIRLLNSHHVEFPHLRLLLSGGEALSSDAIHNLLGKVTIANGYGVTEAAVCTTCHLLAEGDDHSHKAIPIGRPIINTEVYVLDPWMNPVPVGVPGEMYIGGVGLARGYLNRPELTAERFVPHPFSTQPGARLYRTGDRVCYQADGTLLFLGRADEQIKIRGFRVEPGEIETALRSHPMVRDAAVQVYEHMSNDVRLVGYVVCRQPVSVEGLRGWLYERLPYYMIPAQFVFLDALPLTPNGKVDRRALPLPDQKRPSLAQTFIPPRTPVEKVLASMWADILGVQQVGIYDDFFELGGHSLMAAQLITRIRQALRISLPIRAFFETPTIAELAEKILKSGSELLPLASISRSDNEDRAPLSYAQKRIWFLETLTPGLPVYNLPFVVRLKGFLRINVLQQAVQTIVQRHEILRTTFVAIDGIPWQHVHADMPVPLSVTDAAELSEAEIQALIDEEVGRVFDLARGPLLRMRLFRRASDEHILVLTVHHIVFDGWSGWIFFQELAAVYEGYLRGKRPSLPDLPIQYGDYARWQQETQQAALMKEQLTYWKNKLGDELPVLQLPTDHPRPPLKTLNGANLLTTLPPELTNQLRRLSHAEGTTLFMTLLAAFKCLLYRYTGQTDLLVGTPVANRNLVELEGLIGFFVNTLVMRTQIAGEMPFRQFLAQVREVTLAAYDHQDVPFEKLVEVLQPQRNLGQDPVFQVMFVMQNAPAEDIRLMGLQSELLPVPHKTAQFELTLSVMEQGNRLVCEFEYNSDLFEAATIERMAGHFERLLAGIVTAPDTPVARLPLLTEREWEQLLVAWNDTAVSCPVLPVPELFARVVAEMAEKTAVICGNISLTYAELNQQANHLAHYLIEQGVGPETIVGLFLERTLEMAVAVLAVFKAGGAYLPLDTSYPSERLAYMITDADVSLVLTLTRLRDHLPGTDATVICLDAPEVKTAVATFPDTDPVQQLHPDNLAYIIYTSGSTGRPKGVAVSHRGIGNLAQSQRRFGNIHPDSRVLQFAAFGFDGSFYEMFATWLNGATLILPDVPRLLPGPDLTRVINQYQVTNIVLPPSALAVLNPADFPTLQTVLSAGEACSAEIAARWSPGRRFVNAYGPTEGTVAATMTLVTDVSVAPPIGRPLDNVRLYVLDECLNPVPVGVPGELYIAGVGLARGYLNRPDLTAERFLPDLFADVPGSRMYRTGDLVRYRPDGQIEFLGRIDHQVKLRGFRIELGEIEAVLRQITAVRDALVLVREDEPGRKLLVAYLLAENETEDEKRPSSAQIRQYLQQKLPAYMIPSHFIWLDAFPLTPNGKIDRHALPAPVAATDRKDHFVPPRDTLEKRLVAIWEEQLGHRPIGVEDDYFALGGHSLLAVKLFAQLEKEFDIILPLTTLFQKPTVAGLAEAIRQARKRPSLTRSLVPIQPAGTHPPLFCVHGGMGHVLHYRDFARNLGADYPFYALQPKYLPDGVRSAHSQVTEMAAHYIKEIRTVQTEGPYYLAGFCFGGVIALEMAHQLQAMGHEVALLVLIEPSLPSPSLLLTEQAELLTQRVERHRQQMEALPFGQRLMYMTRSVRNRISFLQQQLDLERRRRIWQMRKMYIRLLLALKRPLSIQHRSLYYQEFVAVPALRTYEPRPFAGTAVLFRADEEGYFDPTMGWGTLLPQLKIKGLPTTHIEILREPHIRTVADTVRLYIDQLAEKKNGHRNNKNQQSGK
ncbi:MAG: non-ribosomal peptide synthetase [Chloroflexi bacterium]|nr:MAG: non-ribosomal peptide synthetase [Chloroflexota bacterium]